MRLHPDQALTEAVFGAADPWQPTPAFNPAGSGQSWDERLNLIIETMVGAIAATLGVTFKIQPLSPAEHQAVLEYLSGALPGALTGE
jgi:hypothetical protein